MTDGSGNATPETTHDESKERTFTQAEVDKILGARLHEERSKLPSTDELERLQAAEKELEERKKAELTATELAEKRAEEAEAESERIKAEWEAEKAANAHAEMQRTVAATVGIPAELAARLVGDDEAALKEDAERIKGLLKPESAGGTGGMPADKKQADPSLEAQMKAAREAGDFARLHQLRIDARGGG